MIRERFERLGKIGSGVIPGSFDQSLTLDDLDVAKGDRCAHRVARVSEAVNEIAARLENVDDFLRHRHRADRNISRRQALGHCDHVGFHADSLVAPPVAGPTEAGNDFVAHQEDAVFAADALDLGPIALRRDDDAAGTLDWLADERRDLVGPNFQDLVLDRLGAMQPERIGVHVATLVEPIGLADMLDSGDG